jgi:cyclophilin family peptidyl-prolyl cis-trans isomerase
MSFVLASLVALQELFTTPLALEEMRDKQAVVETSFGEMVFDLLPEKAPNHVGYFMKLAAEGAYDGTSFHRVVKYGIVQGGDPVTRDPNASTLAVRSQPSRSRESPTPRDRSSSSW